jgi:hypothetical protein
MSRSHRQRGPRNTSRALRQDRQHGRRAERRLRHQAVEAVLAQARARDPGLEVRADALEEAGHLALAEALRSASEPDVGHGAVPRR